MQGIQYVTDEKGQKVAVQINLRKFGEIWEDLFDNLLSRQRAITRRITMKNIEMKLEGNILAMKVDLTKEFGPSSSGKTIIIASTEGNVSIPDHDDKKVGLNVYRKK